MSLIHFDVITAKSLGNIRTCVQEQKYAKIMEKDGSDPQEATC